MVKRWSSRPRWSSRSIHVDLRLLVPEGNLTAAERRRARDISVGDLVAIARGIDPLAHLGAVRLARWRCRT